MPLQFQVPQFVDVEDKIFGPLTAKQFLMFVVNALIGAAIYVAAPLPVFVALIIPITIFFLLLAFYKVNGRSFVWFLYAILHFVLTGKLFLWDRRGETPKIRISSITAVETALARRGMRLAARVGPAAENRIQQLARILDTSGKVVEEDLPVPVGFEKA
ncbi:MAG: PrgI family protein [bacterium]|nr:PrgI family protein [bacterium]